MIVVAVGAQPSTRIVPVKYFSPRGPVIGAGLASQSFFTAFNVTVNVVRLRAGMLTVPCGLTLKSGLFDVTVTVIGQEPVFTIENVSCDDESENTHFWSVSVVSLDALHWPATTGMKRSTLNRSGHTVSTPVERFRVRTSYTNVVLMGVVVTGSATTSSGGKSCLLCTTNAIQEGRVRPEGSEERRRNSVSQSCVDAMGGTRLSSGIMIDVVVPMQTVSAWYATGATVGHGHTSHDVRPITTTLMRTSTGPVPAALPSIVVTNVSVVPDGVEAVGAYVAHTCTMDAVCPLDETPISIAPALLSVAVNTNPP